MSFRTQRERLIQAYDQEDEDYVLSTMPYHSVASLQLTVEDADETNGVCQLVADVQEFGFFDFGRGRAPIVLGADNAHRPTRADTNLSKSKSTNGASDFVVEGFAMHVRGARALIEDSGWPGPGASAHALAAQAGTLPVFDPAALLLPPQVHSPFNLEQGLYGCILPFISLVAQFDENTIKPLGTCDLLPQAGAASYLRTSGEPTSDNRFRIDEGYIWRRDGQTDGEFSVMCKVEEPVVIYANLVTPPGGQTPVAPTTIWLDLVMRVYGVEVEGLGQN